MAWIKSFQELGRHPKTRRLARLLDEGLPCTIGRLHLLWWWARDYAPDGDLSRMSWEDIADACLWDGDATRFGNALLHAGFLDRPDDDDTVTIHDWDQYVGKDLQHQRDEVTRVREYRAKQGTGKKSRVTRNKPVANETATAYVPESYAIRGEERRLEENTRIVDAAAPTPPESSVKATPKPNRGAEVVDLLKAADVPYAFTKADGAAIKGSNATPEQIAEVYIALARGEWGDDFMQRQLSIRYAVSKVAAYQASRASPARSTRNGKRYESISRQDEWSNVEPGRALNPGFETDWYDADGNPWPAKAEGA